MKTQLARAALSASLMLTVALPSQADVMVGAGASADCADWLDLRIAYERGSAKPAYWQHAAWIQGAISGINATMIDVGKREIPSGHRTVLRNRRGLSQQTV